MKNLIFFILITLASCTSYKIDEAYVDFSEEEIYTTANVYEANGAIIIELDNPIQASLIALHTLLEYRNSSIHLFETTYTSSYTDDVYFVTTDDGDTLGINLPNLYEVQMLIYSDVRNLLQ